MVSSSPSMVPNMEAILAKATMQAQHPITMEQLQEYKASLASNHSDTSLDDKHGSPMDTSMESTYEMGEMQKIAAS